MKKYAIILVALAFISCNAEAKDYAKMQVKEMKHAQKYATIQKVLQNKVHDSYEVKQSSVSLNIKDPHIMKFGDYEIISEDKYNAKIKKDEVKYKEYAKLLGKKHSKLYATQADSEDFYTIYRIAEKLIRANKLDYMSWRIYVKKDVESANAYSDGANLIMITTSLFDTFSNNDDALAFVIGHEMGHALLGHFKRRIQLADKMERERKLASFGNPIAATAYLGMKGKFLIDSKNMEYAADVEGTKLAMHAGYNLNNASDVLTFLSLHDFGADFRKTHPNSQKRLENFYENKKYFPEEWKDMGMYNIYNSEVLPVQLSSDRKSIVITPSKAKLNPNQYYAPETMEEVYARFGYMYYINGQFDKSLEYFGELFKINQTNASAYLYASYASEYLYKKINDTKYLALAKEYAKKAQTLDSKNKYINEQVNAL